MYPMILVGVIAGTMCYQQFPHLPLGFCVSCFMTLFQVPSAQCPLHFHVLAIFVCFNGLYQTVPIYVACVTSYTIVCGSGIFTALQMRAIKQAEAAEKAKAERDDSFASKGMTQSTSGLSVRSGQ